MDRVLALAVAFMRSPALAVSRSHSLALTFILDSSSRLMPIGNPQSKKMAYRFDITVSSICLRLGLWSVSFPLSIYTASDQSASEQAPLHVATMCIYAGAQEMQAEDRGSEPTKPRPTALGLAVLNSQNRHHHQG